MASLVGGNETAHDVRILALTRPWSGTAADVSWEVIPPVRSDDDASKSAGDNLVYGSGDRPSAGTVTSPEEAHSGVASCRFTSLHLDAPDYAGWLRPEQASQPLAALLAGDNSVNGTDFADYLQGSSGHDYMIGGAGADTLFGGDGNDHMYGQSAVGGDDGPDILSGGNGSDYLQGNAGRDTLDGGGGSDRMNGGADDDLMLGAGGNDSINGNKGNDTIQGGDDNDYLRGGQGNDVLDGGAGDDVLMGDFGADTFTGGEGHDVIRYGFSDGGAGYVGSDVDVVTDFESGIDHISIGYRPVAIHDYGVSDDPIPALAALASGPMMMGLGFYDVTVYHTHGDTVVLWRSQTSSIIDYALLLPGDHQITLSDFI